MGEWHYLWRIIIIIIKENNYKVKKLFLRTKQSTNATSRVVFAKRKSIAAFLVDDRNWRRVAPSFALSTTTLPTYNLTICSFCFIKTKRAIKLNTNHFIHRGARLRETNRLGITYLLGHPCKQKPQFSLSKFDSKDYFDRTGLFSR